MPGRKRWGFLTPPVDGAVFLAAFVANCFLGALPPVDFLAVCLVLAMTIVGIINKDEKLSILSEIQMKIILLI